MMDGFYLSAASWVAEDREVARLVVRDLADYLARTHGKKELPPCWPLLFWQRRSLELAAELPPIEEGWENDPEAKRFLRERGYFQP